MKEKGWSYFKNFFSFTFDRCCLSDSFFYHDATRKCRSQKSKFE